MYSTFQLIREVDSAINHNIQINDSRYTKEQIVQGLNDGVYFIVKSGDYCVMNESYKVIAEIKESDIFHDNMLIPEFEENE